MSKRYKTEYLCPECRSNLYVTSLGKKLLCLICQLYVDEKIDPLKDVKMLSKKINYLNERKHYYCKKAKEYTEELEKYKRIRQKLKN